MRRSHLLSLVAQTGELLPSSPAAVFFVPEALFATGAILLILACCVCLTQKTGQGKRLTLWTVLAGLGLAILALILVGGGFAVGVAVGLRTRWLPAASLDRLPCSLPAPVHNQAEPSPLRWTMVHEALHDHVPLHGKEYYRERNRLRNNALANDPGADYFALVAELAEGLEVLGQPDRAIQLLQDELLARERQGQKGLDLAGIRARLGACLVRTSLSWAILGDEAAEEKVREGISLLRKANGADTQLHQSDWQALYAAFMLETLEQPLLLLEYDLVGNRLNETLALSGYESSAASTSFRQQVGGAAGWARIVPEGPRGPFACDEAVLAILAEWRGPQGPTVYLALTLGEILARVGQHRLAWCAFERASRLTDQCWRGEVLLEDALYDHCKSRQRLLEATWTAHECVELRKRFENDLAAGQQYQNALHLQERERLQAGVSPDHASFDQLSQQTQPVADSKEQRFVVSQQPDPLRRALPAGVLGAGLFAFLGASVLRWAVGNKK